MTPAADQRHLLTRLVWDSDFDAPGEVRAQQDWLSAFSRVALPDLLNDVFNACCPPDQTWRCEHLQIDLGKIALADAEEDLPRRLRSVLTEALHKQFGPAATPGTQEETDDPGTPRLLQQTASGTVAAHANSLELLAHLLMHGSTPWWNTGPSSVPALWDGLFASEPDALTRQLHRLGQYEPVRERLVWQLGRARMPALLRLVQPVHVDAMTEWVREVVARHVEEQLVPDQASAFENEAWLALLTCLMADRGSVFNTTEFASAQLRQLAARYNIAHATLLARLQQSCTRRASALPRRFIALVRAVCARDLTPPAPVLAAPLFDPWHAWPAMLARGQSRLAPAQGGHSLQQLFLNLAELDSQRTAALLQAAGSAAGTVLAQHLSDAALHRVVQLLQPGEATFIAAHVAHSQQLAQRQHWPRRAVWQVVLAFLLAEHVSRFERRQLLDTTLRHWCLSHNLAYDAALSMLIASAQNGAPAAQRYALLQVLLELRNETRPAVAATRLAPATVDNARIGERGAVSPPAATYTSDQLWRAWRWRLRGARSAPGMAPDLARLSLAALWRSLPQAELRRWLLRQPDRAQLLPQLAALPGAQRWLARLVPHALRPVPELLEQALAWLPACGLWQGSGAALRRLLEPLLWQLALDPRAAHVTRAEFLARCLLQWCQALHVSASECADHASDNAPTLVWRQACAQLRTWAGGADVTAPSVPDAAAKRATALQRPDAWGAWLHQPEAAQMLLRLLCQRSPTALHRRHGVAGWPAGASAAQNGEAAAQRLAAVVYQLTWMHPQTLRRLLAQPWQRATLRPRLTARLQAALSLPQLMDLVRRTPSSGSALPQLLGAWRQWQARLPLPHLKERDDWLWRMLWEAWLYEDWRRLDAKRLMAGFCQFFLPLAGMNAVGLARCLRAGAGGQPQALTEALLALPEDGTAAAVETTPRTAPHARGEKAAAPALPMRPARPEPKPLPSLAGQRLAVSNAGIVLLHSFLPMLFSRLDLMQDSRFVNAAATRRAVLCLQYLACAQSAAEEPDLALNKVLCGLAPNQAVETDIDLSGTETDAMEGMLSALCGHWPQSGCNSAAALRGNWLLRTGVLADAGDHWSLTIERKPWDFLLAGCPFPYSVIKLPWMAKALYVTWPS